MTEQSELRMTSLRTVFIVGEKQGQTERGKRKVWVRSKIGDKKAAARPILHLAKVGLDKIWRGKFLGWLAVSYTTFINMLSTYSSLRNTKSLSFLYRSLLLGSSPIINFAIFSCNLSKAYIFPSNFPTRKRSPIDLALIFFLNLSKSFQTFRFLWKQWLLSRRGVRIPFSPPNVFPTLFFRVPDWEIALSLRRVFYAHKQRPRKTEWSRNRHEPHNWRSIRSLSGRSCYRQPIPGFDQQFFLGCSKPHGANESSEPSLVLPAVPYSLVVRRLSLFVVGKILQRTEDPFWGQRGIFSTRVRSAQDLARGSTPFEFFRWTNFCTAFWILWKLVVLHFVWIAFSKDCTALGRC